MTDQELVEMERITNQATEGPWHYYPCGEKSNDCILGPAFDENGKSPPPGRIECSPYNDKTGEFEMDKYIIDPVLVSKENDASYEDFAFIAHARTWVPKLIKEVKRLKKKLKGKS